MRAILKDALRERCWWTRTLLLIATAGLLTLAFAPFYQFYLAWVALVPWLFVVRSSRSLRAALFWGWIAGLLLFLPNFAYLLYITVPGAIALSAYMALFWALAAGAVYGIGLFSARNRVAIALATPVIWVSTEWLRGTLLTGLPWLYLGHSQSPLLPMCQIADVTGVYGVSFCLMLVNVVVFLAIIERHRLSGLIPAAAVTGLIIGGIWAYGVFRLHQQTTVPGPRVMVVQPNIRHVRGVSEPAETQQQKSLDFHLSTTLAALKDNPADLIVWSETVIPPLNDEARARLHDAPSGAFLERVHAGLAALTTDHQVALLTGSYYVGGWNEKGKATDIRNAAFFYNPVRRKITRYDKIHLVPFGEFIPFRLSLPWLFQAFMWLSPYEEEYSISAGSAGEITVFTLDPRGVGPSSHPWRFVTPICFEDIDAPLVARMFRGEGGTKRADFIVNITNDGWFRFNQMPQHLQAAIFRSIENRAPTARSVNTGISGFIDSVGRPSSLLEVRNSGTSTSVLNIDSRRTFYTHFGDLFAISCVVAAATLVVVSTVRPCVASLRVGRIARANEPRGHRDGWPR